MESLIERFRGGVYVFEKGDTLKSVAEKFNTTERVIICDNNLTAPPVAGQAAYIAPGEKVIVTGVEDDILSVCKNYGVSENEIYRLNKTDYIYPLMRLIVK